MDEQIRKRLAQLEYDDNVKVLFACEAGSRAAGLASPKSDYDVRFIYIHPLEWYLSIANKKDHMDFPSEHPLDIHGWDIRKALKLLRNSNPSLLEWLQSEIVYRKEDHFFHALQQLARDSFSPKKGLYHYTSMARRNYRKLLQSDPWQQARDLCDPKPYFYILRPIFASQWMVQFRSIPPLRFQNLMNELSIESAVKDTIEQLFSLRAKGRATATSFDLQAAIHPFIEQQLAWLEEEITLLLKDNKPPLAIERYDHLLKETLTAVWNK